MTHRKCRHKGSKVGVEGHVGPLSLGLLGSNYRVNGVRVYGEVSVGWGAEEAGMEPDDECLWFNVDHRCSSQPSDGGAAVSHAQGWVVGMQAWI